MANICYGRNSLLVVSFCIISIASYGQNPASSKFVRPGYKSLIKNSSPAKANPSVHTNAVQSATPGITDHNDVQIFPSANEQSEVHISTNMQNPNILVASANTYPGNYNQGRYASTNGGVTWSGSDILNIVTAM